MLFRSEEAPILYVELADNIVAQRYIDDPEGKEQLEALITEKIGKSVQVQMIVSGSCTSGELAELSVDDIIKKEIHMDVEIEN